MMFVQADVRQTLVLASFCGAIRSSEGSVIPFSYMVSSTSEVISIAVESSQHFTEEQVLDERGGE